VVTSAGRDRAVRRFFLNWLREYLAKENVVDTEILASLDRALESYCDGAGPEDGSSDHDDGYDIRQMMWWLRVAAGNRASLEFPAEDAGTVRVVVEKAGTGISHDIQLNVPRLRIEATQWYAVRFRARADRPRAISWGIARSYPPWTNLGVHREIGLTPEWQWVEDGFVSHVSANNARLYFDTGGGDISIEIGSVGVRSAEDGRRVGPYLGALGAGVGFGDAL
jgi:hypothetical protein